MNHPEMWTALKTLYQMQRRVPLRPFDPARPMPLSFPQRRLLDLHRLDPGSSAHNLPYALRLSGPLDTVALTKSFREILRRHEILRGASGEFDCPNADVGVTALSATIDREACAPFDLEGEAPFRARLFRLGWQDHLLLMIFHHIAFDGWSESIFFRDMEVAYDAFHKGGQMPPDGPKAAYASYAAWQLEYLSDGATLTTLLSAWLSLLREEIRGWSNPSPG